MPLVVKKKKPDIVTANGMDEPQGWCSAVFKGRMFAAKGRRIRWQKDRWSEVGDSDLWPESNYIDLPTGDAAKLLVANEDELYLYCEYEIWEIVPTSGNMQFCAYRTPHQPVYSNNHKAVGFI